MKPKFANNWYSEVPTQQLRQEVQAIYDLIVIRLPSAPVG